MKEKIEWLKDKWNKLDKNAKLFACGVVIILVAGILWS